MKDGSRYLEDNADETQGEPSYFDDTDSDLEGSSSSYQDDFEESSEGKYHCFSVSNVFKDKLPRQNYKIEHL